MLAARTVLRVGSVLQQQAPRLAPARGHFTAALFSAAVASEDVKPPKKTQRRQLLARSGYGGTGRKVSCRHILVERESTLDDVAIELESGTPFEGASLRVSCLCFLPGLAVESSVFKGGSAGAELAQQHSICPSKSCGGDIGWIIRGMASSGIEEAVLHKPVGSVVRAESEGG